MDTLRSRVIRLASADPSLRPHLLPLLKEAGGPSDVLAALDPSISTSEDRYVDLQTDHVWSTVFSKAFAADGPVSLEFGGVTFSKNSSRATGFSGRINGKSVVLEKEDYKGESKYHWKVYAVLQKMIQKATGWKDSRLSGDLPDPMDYKSVELHAKAKKPILKGQWRQVGGSKGGTTRYEAETPSGQKVVLLVSSSATSGTFPGTRLRDTSQEWWIGDVTMNADGWHGFVNIVRLKTRDRNEGAPKLSAFVEKVFGISWK